VSTRAALVTGAASGIGRAIAAHLEADGWNVLAVDLAPDPDGPGAPFAADLMDASANAAAVGVALERFGRLDAVIPNAGFQHVAHVEEFPEEQWDRLLAVLLTSPFLLAKHAWPALRASGDGRIVVVASVHGLVASPFKAGYVAAKHGVLGLVKTLALEGAADGIAVCAVCPGYVRTPLVESQVAAQAAAHGIAEERVLEDVLLASQAVKELLEPQAVAEAVAYLLGPAGRFATGAPLVLDGGWTAR
jgi:3-hydroxybutyrate dehydrogenase